MMTAEGNFLETFALYLRLSTFQRVPLHFEEAHIPNNNGSKQTRPLFNGSNILVGLIFLFLLQGCCQTTRSLSKAEPDLVKGKVLLESREKSAPWVISTNWIGKKRPGDVELLGDLKLKLISGHNGKNSINEYQRDNKFSGTPFAERLSYVDSERPTTSTYTITVKNTGSSNVIGAVLTVPAVSDLTKTLVACSPTPGECTVAPTVAQLESGIQLPFLAVQQTYQILVTFSENIPYGNKEIIAASIEPPNLRLYINKHFNLAFAPFSSQLREEQCGPGDFINYEAHTELQGSDSYPTNLGTTVGKFESVIVMRNEINNRDFCGTKKSVSTIDEKQLRARENQLRAQKNRWSHHFRVVVPDMYHPSLHELKDFLFVGMDKITTYLNVILEESGKWKIVHRSEDPHQLDQEEPNQGDGSRQESKIDPNQINIDYFNSIGKRKDCDFVPEFNVCPMHWRSHIPVIALQPENKDKLTASFYTYRSTANASGNDERYGDQIRIEVQVNPTGEAELSLLTMHRQPWNPIFYVTRDFTISGSSLRDIGENIVAALAVQAGVVQDHGGDRFNRFENPNDTPTDTHPINVSDLGTSGVAGTYSVSDLVPRFVYLDMGGEIKRFDWRPNLGLHTLLAEAGLLNSLPHGEKDKFFEVILNASIRDPEKIKKNEDGIKFWVSSAGAIFSPQQREQWVPLFPNDVVKADVKCGFKLAE